VNAITEHVDEQTADVQQKANAQPAERT
ncbi:MAG: hypothetical protein QOD72_766, partial [Acidimicrobiaceae bacterium]|nr:hypothetical protein [Acidimicrobiaceae bacterium]